MNEQEARDEIAQMILDATYQPAWGECVRAADAIIAAGYRKHPEADSELAAVEAARAFLCDALAESDESEASGETNGWDVEVDARTVLRILDDAEPRKHPEPEWEYRTTVGGYDPQPHGRLNRGETTVSEVLARFADDERPLVLERRIKAGPWEPVEGSDS